MMIQVDYSNQLVSNDNSNYSRRSFSGRRSFSDGNHDSDEKCNYQRQHHKRHGDNNDDDGHSTTTSTWCCDEDFVIDASATAASASGHDDYSFIDFDVIDSQKKVEHSFHRIAASTTNTVGPVSASDNNNKVSNDTDSATSVVSFGIVEIHEFPIGIGYNSVPQHGGVPIGLYGFQATNVKSMTVDEHEMIRLSNNYYWNDHQDASSLAPLTRAQRRTMLLDTNVVSMNEIQREITKCNKLRRNRQRSSHRSETYDQISSILFESSSSVSSVITKKLLLKNKKKKNKKLRRK